MRPLTPILIMLAAVGCGPEFQLRNDIDLFEIDAKRVAELRRCPDSVTYATGVTARSQWQIHSSLAGIAALTDGDPATLALSSGTDKHNKWILIDLGACCRFRSVRQVHAAGTEPRSYRIDTAGEQGFPYTLQFVGTGTPGESMAVLPRVIEARFIRITLSEDTAEPWGIGELDVF